VKVSKLNSEVSATVEDIRRSFLTPEGLEVPDGSVVEIPTRLRLPQRQVDRVRELIRQEMSRAAEADQQESFEEADDFGIDGEDPVSPYEEVFEPELTSAVEGGIMDVRGNGSTVKEMENGQRSDGPAGKVAVDGAGTAPDSGGAGNGSGVAGKAEQSVDGASRSESGEGKRSGVRSNRK